MGEQMAKFSVDDDDLLSVEIPYPTPDREREILAEIAAMEKTAAAGDDMQEKRKREMEMFHAFKRTPSKETFAPLYASFKPLLYTAAQPNMSKSPIPQAAHTALAAQSFMDALRTFDAKKGGSLRTHVFNNVREKGKRLNLKYQNIGYIPEARATKYSLFQSATAMLRGNLGREPSAADLADELGWSVKMVETMQKEMRGNRLVNEEIAEAHALPVFQSDKAKQVFNDMYYDLISPHQVVLEHTVGLNGKQALAKPGGGHDVHAIAKATGMTVGQVNSALKTITRKYKEYTGHGKSLYDNLSVGVEPE
jgi:DNA-directed RNA polymerase specialized sigma subunit